MENNRILAICSPLDYLLIKKILDRDFLLISANKRDIQQIINDHEYDFIIIDANYIKNGKEETIKILKEQKLPMLAISSDREDLRNQRLKDYGCTTCYIMPIQTHSFLSFIKEWTSSFQVENTEMGD